jgi:hypothetical protein
MTDMADQVKNAEGKSATPELPGDPVGSRQLRQNFVPL